MSDDESFRRRLLAAIGPGFERLAPPDPDKLAAARELPEGLRRFYAEHDGQFPESEFDGALFGLHVLPLHPEPSSPGPISAMHRSLPAGAVVEGEAGPRWPFAGDVFSGDGMIFVDEQPGPAGTVGQVVVLDRLHSKLVVLGEDMDGFVELLIRIRLERHDLLERRDLLAALPELAPMLGLEPRDFRLPRLPRVAPAPGRASAPSREHTWQRSLAHDDPELSLVEQLERAAFDLLRGLIAEGELLTASTRGARVLAPGAGRIMAQHRHTHARAAALAEWLLDEDEVSDLLLDDEALAARLEIVFPEPT